MTGLFTNYRSYISERVGTITVAAVLLLMYVTDQISLFALLLTGSLTAFILVQLEIKRRLEVLKLRRFDKDADLADRRGIHSLRTAALNGLPSPIILVGRNKRIAVANQAAKELFSAPLIGDDVLLYFRDPKLVEAIESMLADEGAHKGRITLSYTTTNDRSFDVTAAPIEADALTGDSEPHLMLFFFEITSLLRTEQMRVDFVANASHELRTPLSSLMGSIETLQGPARDDAAAQDRFLGIMQRESGRMVRLIDDLLSLSRIELSRHKLPDTVVEPSKLLRSAMNSLLDLGAERGLTFRLDCPDALPTVTADDDQITQVLLNLLVNAAKYAEADTTVHVTATLTAQGRHVQFTIRDEGPGISAEHLGRLTERFYRVDTARSRKMGGTGLGLAIVKHILLRHNSQLEIKSKLGEGSSFSFKLAVANQDTLSVVEDAGHQTLAEPTRPVGDAAERSALAPDSTGDAASKDRMSGQAVTG